MGEYSSKLVKGAGIILIMMMTSSVISYFIRLILAKKFTTEEFGLFFAVYSIVLLIGWIKNFGLTSAIQKFIPEMNIKEEYSKIKFLLIFVFSFVLLSGGFFLLLAYCLPPEIINSYFKNSLGASLLIILLIYIIFDGLSQVLTGYFIAKSNYFLYSLKDFIFRLLILITIILIPLTIINVGWVYVFSAIIVFLLNTIIFLRLSPFLKQPFLFHKELITKITYFSVPLVARDFLGVIMSYIDTIALVFFRPLKEVAIYNAILPTADLLLIFGRPFGRIMFPLSSELFTLGKNDQIILLLKKIHKNLFLLLIPLYGGIFIFSNFILGTFFGTEYTVGVLGLRILALGLLIASLNITSYEILIGIGKVKEATHSIIISNIVNVILNILLIPIFGHLNQGYLGAIIGTVISSFIAFIISEYFLRKHLSYHFPLRETIIATFSGVVILLLIMVAIPRFNLVAIKIIVAISFFSLLYPLLLILFGATSITEIKEFVKMMINRNKIVKN